MKKFTIISLIIFGLISGCAPQEKKLKVEGRLIDAAYFAGGTKANVIVQLERDGNVDIINFTEGWDWNGEDGDWRDIFDINRGNFCEIYYRYNGNTRQIIRVVNLENKENRFLTSTRFYPEITGPPKPELVPKPVESVVSK